MSGNFFRGGRGRGKNRGGFGRGPPKIRGNWNNYGGRGGGFRGRPGSGFGGPEQNFGRPKNNEQKWQKGPKPDRPTKRLSEQQIGITEYVSDHEGFLGIIKSRYSDFQVSEINERGEVAKLTDQAPPEGPKGENYDEDEDLFNKYNVEILPMDTWDQINKIAKSKASEEQVDVDVTGMTKEQRTKIHESVKRAFGNLIVGSTVQEGETKFVRFQRYRKGIRIDNRVKWPWPAEYTHFVVYKENMDTMDAAQRLAERIRISLSASLFGYAGTKDRRAKTSQWFSLRKVDPHKIYHAAQGMPGLHVGNYSFSNTHLKLGMLQGNRFRIALRNVTVDDSVVDVACSRMQEQGFINYYGLQRFGTCVEMPTYQIGLKLLQRNFTEALAGILSERKGILQHALRVYATDGAQAALDAWPARARGALERRVLQALVDRPTDLLGAINKLARNTRLLYLHSYQSLLWNLCVSERLRRHGLRAHEGDLVAEEPLAEEYIPNSIEETEDMESEEPNQDGDDDKMADENKMADTDKESPQESSAREPKYKVPVKILTQEDVDSGKYTIFDIVMPLPGYMIVYPPNMKEYYDELLAKDGVTIKLTKKYRSLCLSGAYRHLVVKPGNMQWRCVRYDDPHADLIASDLDQIRGREVDGTTQDGKYKALLLSMDLRASCYATMALRELLKVDTACDNQALQNNYHKKDDSPNGDKCQSGEVTSHSEEVSSHSGEVSSHSGEDTSHSGEVTSHSGEVTSHSGEVTSHSGEVTSHIESEISQSEKEECESGEKRKANDVSNDLDVKKAKQE